ncbi:FAD-binding domain-containing protein [Trichoderma barbatum]
MLGPADIYMYCFVGCFLVLFIFQNIIPHVVPTLRVLIILPARAIGYYFLINRHALIGPITVASTCFQMIYIGANIASLVYGIDSVAQAASRAGTLSLINLVPLYLTMHLSFIADVLGMSLHTYRQLHQSCGVVAMGHIIFHGAVALTHQSRLSPEMPTADWYPLIGAAAIIVLVFLSIPFFRRRWYETFLRLHQLLAIGVVVFVINHLLSIVEYQWTPLYIFVGFFFLLGAFYSTSIMYHNRPGSNSRLKAEYINDNIVSATITRSRSLHIKPGQYLNIWVPSVSLFSTHPFTVVASWESSSQTHISLLIKPRNGFTKKLVQHLSNDQKVDLRVFFSGPHGISAPVQDFDYILLFATGFGIATMLPYLTQLVHGCKERRTKAKRVHLIWQVYNLDLREAVKDIINPLFKDDNRSSANILYLSIYNEIDINKESSEHGHYTINPNKPEVASIIKAESAHIDVNSKTLVLVSANEKMRDNIRQAIRGYLSIGFKLEELDYQP